MREILILIVACIFTENYARKALKITDWQRETDRTGDQDFRVCILLSEFQFGL